MWVVRQSIDVVESGIGLGGMAALLTAIDPELVIDMIFGSYIAERARTGPVSQSWASRVVAVLSPVLERTS